ncbi:hypothetical protein MWU75_00230 [Ornithinimicrobium sp. F0845]|uniref:VOC family protein n=1 Tax=Ornithinimicrobium sp. F0845 TaxID=2926412 RepID=UPI001FF20C56|nr:VOC family protein [Ornithinimicrobium sp. F0845]MCK0110573.1 hypothetical protein [Ornithinimicrobium sp. F0845]
MHIPLPAPIGAAYREGVRALTLQIDAFEPAGLGRFWADLLGLPLESDPRGPLIAGDDRRPGLRFTLTRTEPTVPNPIHLPLTNAVLTDQDRTVERAVALGGRPGRSPRARRSVAGGPPRAGRHGGQRVLRHRGGERLPGGLRLPRRVRL